MPQLPANPTIKDFQTYVAEMIQERGFKCSIPEVFMKFLEESGEMAKAAKKHDKTLHARHYENEDPLDEEIADVFMYLLDITNKFEIDLETAFRKKEEKNKLRKWNT